VGALAVIAAVPRVAPAFILIAMVGLSGTVFDITGRTLLQRAAPPGAIAGSFSILEAPPTSAWPPEPSWSGWPSASAGAGCPAGPGGGGRSAHRGLWRQLTRIDATANVPQVEIQLLRSPSIFAALSPPSLEGVARQLEPVPVAAGTWW